MIGHQEQFKHPKKLSLLEQRCSNVPRILFALASTTPKYKSLEYPGC